MDRESILRILSENAAQIRRMGVKSLAVFGSVVRGEATPQSDVDVLVSFQGPVTFDRYMDVKLYLEDRLECPVDLVIAEALHQRLRPYVQQEAVYVT